MAEVEREGPVYWANQGVRFLLELAALGAVAFWGWTQHAGVGRVAWAVGPVLVAAVLWGTFRVPDDPGPAPVAVPGPVRLALEAVLFGAAGGLLSLAGRPGLAAGFAAAVVLHYAVDHRRVLWLLGG